MKATKQQLAEWDKELDQLHERNGDLGLEVQNLKEELADRDKEIAELRSELSDLKQNSATASQDLPDLTEKAGELLSFFKSLLPKNTKLANGTISKIEKILEG